MKRFGCLVAVMAGMTMTAAAVTMEYSFSPRDADLGNLPHNSYFTWGIDWTVPQDGNGQDMRVSRATLTFDHIYDWKYGEPDNLFVHLLDDPLYHSGYHERVRRNMKWWGTTKKYRDHRGGGDNFAGSGPLIANWSDPVGGYQRHFDLVIDIDPSHFDLMSDGSFGFGIDPDCHYYNCGVRLDIEVSSPQPDQHTVPDGGATMMLMGLALPGLMFLRSRR